MTWPLLISELIQFRLEYFYLICPKISKCTNKMLISDQILRNLLLKKADPLF